jgi:hypothetical protein
VDSAIRRAVLRTLATGSLLVAIVPGSAVLLTRPHAPKSIVLQVTVTPERDDPTLAG